jgi:hypothetical protein
MPRDRHKKPGPFSRDQALVELDRRTRAGRVLKGVIRELTLHVGDAKATRLALLSDQLLDGTPPSGVARLAELADDSARISPEFWGQARLARQHFAGSAVVSAPMKSIALAARAAYSTLTGAIPPRVVASTHRRWLALAPAGLVLQDIVPAG